MKDFELTKTKGVLHKISGEWCQRRLAFTSTCCVQLTIAYHGRWINYNYRLSLLVEGLPFRGDTNISVEDTNVSEEGKTFLFFNVHVSVFGWLHNFSHCSHSYFWCWCDAPGSSRAHSEVWSCQLCSPLWRSSLSTAQQQAGGRELTDRPG